MSTTGLSRILLPTDLGDQARFQLSHGLGLALAAEAQLIVAHVQPDEGPPRPWSLRPLAANLLVAWGKLASADQDPMEAGAQIVQVTADGGDPVSGILTAASHAGTDLLVLGTARRTGVERVLHSSVAEAVALGFGGPTLFLGSGTRGIVDGDTGALTVRSVLVPVGDGEEAQDGMDAAAFVLKALGLLDARIDVLHVGDEEDDYPHLSVPEGMRMQWRRRSGNVVDGVLAEAAELDSDLIVMATQGHDSVLDALRGSRTERVMREAKCPLLAVPALT